jgi:hypothetical protein
MFTERKTLVLACAGSVTASADAANNAAAIACASHLRLGRRVVVMVCDFMVLILHVCCMDGHTNTPFAQPLVDCACHPVHQGSACKTAAKYLPPIRFQGSREIVGRQLLTDSRINAMPIFHALPDVPDMLHFIANPRKVVIAFAFAADRRMQCSAMDFPCW